MFSFHKPKIYRSNLGCCICKAKSSSSRFTDSKKYENEFERCFRIQEKRSGEICNACVLLVKRWKKLSPENRQVKHWHHVVDARAGPGTKLTGNRRQHASYCSTGLGNSSNDNSSSGVLPANTKQRNANVLPLSSSQANNQTGAGATSVPGTSSAGTSTRRTNAFSNKACAIDTNVSTFTFGEPYRRHYGPEPVYLPGSFAKPQSALNSSAFESVIKRFRQRKQQEQLEAERRQQNRMHRMTHHGTHSQQQSKANRDEESSSSPVPADARSASETERVDQVLVADTPTLPPSKRVKRHSDSIGSLSVDGTRISTLLDSSLWRKERICCGIIFRGLNNEVAVFPKLLKPCPCRARRLGLNQNQSGKKDAKELTESGNQEQLLRGESPPPRATKSGSISSCDSNTSGTGSMEQPIIAKIDMSSMEQSVTSRDDQEREIEASKMANLQVQSNDEVSKRKTRQSACTRGRARTLRQGADTDSLSSSSSSTRSAQAAVRPPRAPQSPAASHSSSSEASSSRLLMMDECDDDIDDGLILADDDVSTTDDADSSVGSISELDSKKPGANVVDAAMG